MAAAPSGRPTEFNTISDVFERFCARSGLTVLSEAVEKHGSWEWAAAQPGTIDRFVSIGITEEPRGLDTRSDYTVDLWAEAEKAGRPRLGHRVLVERFHETLGDLGGKPTQKRLAAALVNAWRRAIDLQEPDLHELTALRS